MSYCRFGFSNLQYISFSMLRWETAFPSATRPPAAARQRHGYPTWQHNVPSAEQQAPTPNSASGGRRKELSRGRLAHSPGKEPIRRGEGFPSFSEAFSSRGLFFASGVSNNSKALVPQNVHGCGSKGANPVGFWVLGLSHLRGETGGEI